MGCYDFFKWLRDVFKEALYEVYCWADKVLDSLLGRFTEQLLRRLMGRFEACNAKTPWTKSGSICVGLMLIKLISEDQRLD